MDVNGLAALPGVCEGAYGVRKVFVLDGVRLVVPDAVTDKSLRWLLDDRGMSLEAAYGQVGWTTELPEQGMRDCCLNVLRQKWLDNNLEWQLSGWGYTCSAYHACLENYVLALRETNKRGRIKIAAGLYAPSPAEEECIKHRFAIYRDIARSYSECKALEILPKFTGAIANLNHLMSVDLENKAHGSMYKMISVAYSLGSGGETPIHHAPPPSNKEETPNYMLYIGLGVGGALLLLTLGK